MPKIGKEEEGRYLGWLFLDSFHFWLSHHMVRSGFAYTRCINMYHTHSYKQNKQTKMAKKEKKIVAGALRIQNTVNPVRVNVARKNGDSRSS